MRRTRRVDELADAHDRYVARHRVFKKMTRFGGIGDDDPKYYDCCSAFLAARDAYVGQYISMYLNDREHCQPIISVIARRDWDDIVEASGFNPQVRELIVFAFPIAPNASKANVVYYDTLVWQILARFPRS
jgi:hypothetical protein